MKPAKLVFLLALTLVLGSGFVARADRPPMGETVVPVPLESLAVEAHATCAVPQTEEALQPATIPLAAGGGHGLTCHDCSSSSECQAICGGEVGSDFVYHFDSSCGPWRVCLCFF